MAKKQTRRSISVSRTTYERLKAFCESNNISMSQLVETRVNDFLGPGDIAPSGPATTMPVTATRFMPPRPTMSGMPSRPLDARPASHLAAAAVPGGASSPAATSAHLAGQAGHPAAQASQASHPSTQTSHPSQAVPMTSAAARFAVEPPPPIIKPRQETAAPKPAEKRPEQIFTF